MFKKKKKSPRTWAIMLKLNRALAEAMLGFIIGTYCYKEVVFL